MTERDAAVFEMREVDALVERIVRLQLLVVELMKKNEDLRQKLVLGLDS